MARMARAELSRFQLTGRPALCCVTLHQFIRHHAGENHRLLRAGTIKQVICVVFALTFLLVLLQRLGFI
jgi:hypothetical protein